MKKSDGENWNQKGQVLIIVVIAFIALLAFAALALDVGNLMVTKNELQNISDGASLAATRRLGSIYETMPYADQQTYNCSADAPAIISVAQEVGTMNIAAGVNITINAADVEIGQWNSGTKVFTPTYSQPDAVRVRARRDSSANGPIATFFARILGINTMDVSATGTAALTAESTAGPGGLPVPVGISRRWFEDRAAFNFCNQPIRFYPTNDPSSCAGWHVYDRYSNMNDRVLRDTISDIEAGSYESPETIAYVTRYEFGGGTMSIQTFAAMKSLFDSRKVLNDGTIDNDTDSTTWTTGVPVFDSSDCSNPHGSTFIVGFATIVITNVQDSPVHQIDGYVICNNVEPGRGGGGEYGTKGSIPGLVQ
jgi:Flp pilus assembly protein TadG